MTTALVAVLVLGTVVTLALLAWALVAATDRLRVTVDRLLAVRGEVEPHLEELRAEADRARAHAERIRTTPLRLGDGQTTDG